MLLRLLVHERLVPVAHALGLELKEQELCCVPGISGIAAYPHLQAGIFELVVHVFPVVFLSGG